MSAPRTPTKSAGSKRDESPKPRTPGSQVATPPTGGGQRLSATGSQIGSPAVRSGATSAASHTGNREKINSAASKQNTASPTPGRKIYLERKLFIFSVF